MTSPLIRKNYLTRIRLNDYLNCSTDIILSSAVTINNVKLIFSDVSLQLSIYLTLTLIRLYAVTLSMSPRGFIINGHNYCIIIIIVDLSSRTNTLEFAYREIWRKLIIIKRLIAPQAVTWPYVCVTLRRHVNKICCQSINQLLWSGSTQL